jgi:hypothetical protein
VRPGPSVTSTDAQAAGEFETAFTGKQSQALTGDWNMKKLAKTADRKNKDKYPEELRKDTIECYESTIVNHVVC